MSNKLQSIKGMHDILPTDTAAWRTLEQHILDVVSSYGYQEIRMPILEHSEVFKRPIGELTDIVQKEMYTFEDRNGDSLTLRPEGTASCVRAALEHGLLYKQTQRLWYGGAMFRHERPQKGRYRQFHQVGVEAYGMPGPDIDAEMILMTVRMWQRLGLGDLRLEINTLGTSKSRSVYRQALQTYFRARENELDDDSRSRLEGNPLRILDSKNPELADLIEQAPRLDGYLDTESHQHFDQLRRLLDTAGVTYRVNPRLVRGLDYYCHLVFEWISDQLGAQGTVCAGGRYDGVVELMGGPATPAVGFAMGLERLIELIADNEPNQCCDFYIIGLDNGYQATVFRLGELLRDRYPDRRTICHCGGGSLKSQMKKADRSGAIAALIIGENEVEANRVTVKPLRGEGTQVSLEYDAAISLLGDLLPEQRNL